MPTYQLSTITEKDLKGIALDDIQTEIEHRTGHPLVLSYAYNLLKTESDQWQKQDPKLMKVDQLFAQLLVLHGKIKTQQKAIKEANARPIQPKPEEKPLTADPVSDDNKSASGTKEIAKEKRLRLAAAQAQAEAEAAEAEIELLQIELSLKAA